MYLFASKVAETVQSTCKPPDWVEAMVVRVYGSAKPYIVVKGPHRSEKSHGGEGPTEVNGPSDRDKGEVFQLHQNGW